MKRKTIPKNSRAVRERKRQLLDRAYREALSAHLGRKVSDDEFQAALANRKAWLLKVRKTGRTERRVRRAKDPNAGVFEKEVNARNRRHWENHEERFEWLASQHPELTKTVGGLDFLMFGTLAILEWGQRKNISPAAAGSLKRGMATKKKVLSRAEAIWKRNQHRTLPEVAKQIADSPNPPCGFIQAKNILRAAKKVLLPIRE